VETLRLWAAVTRENGLPTEHLRDSHRAYMRELAAEQLVFASGPAAVDHGERPFGGITVLQVANREQAEAIMSEEPYIRAGVRTFELIAWEIRRGNDATHS